MGISKNSFKGSIQLPKQVNSNPVTITVSKNKKYTAILDTRYSLNGYAYYKIFEGRTISEKSKPIGKLNLFCRYDCGFTFEKYIDIPDLDAIIITKRLRAICEMDKDVTQGHIYIINTKHVKKRGKTNYREETEKNEIVL